MKIKRVTVSTMRASDLGAAPGKPKAIGKVDKTGPSWKSTHLSAKCKMADPKTIEEGIDVPF